MMRVKNSNKQIAFKSNKQQSVRQIGKFFEQQANDGFVMNFKPVLVNSLGKRVSSNNKTPYVMSLTGLSGSGKTFFSELTKNTLGEKSSAIITGDNLYKDLSGVFDSYGGFDGLIAAKYDLEGPHNFDLVRGAAKINELKSGKDTVHFNKYLMDGTGRILHDAVPVENKPFILFEGICSVFSPLKETFDSRALLKVSRSELERRYFERNRNVNDIELFKAATAAGDKYISSQESDMDLVINGEAPREKMQSFIKGFFEIVKK